MREQSRILITAPKSGSGKTTVTCGILAALKARGLGLTSLKCGPDYIDPMFHRAVLGIRTGNLDSFFTGPEMTRRLLAHHAAGTDITVIEGAMGYFDGLGGVSVRGSSFETGSVTETPAILVADGKGASVTLAAVIRGIASFEPDERTGAGLPERPLQVRRRPDNGIAGIILNRVSPMYYPRLKEVIERETGIPVLGCFPVIKDLEVPSRHLGLVSPEELTSTEQWVRAVGEQAAKYIDLDRLLRIAETAPRIGGGAADEPEHTPGYGGGPERKPGSGVPGAETAQDAAAPAVTKKERPPVRVAVSSDEAFSFLYEENLYILRSLGAEIVPFSPLRDAALPTGTDGMILCGGYPERFAKELSANGSMRAEVAAAVRGGIPCIAECGGFLYLQQSLEDESGTVWPMCGVLDGRGFRTGGLRRFGYLTAVTNRDGLYGPKGTVLRGHEFHHWDTERNGDGMTMTKPLSGRTEQGVVYTPTLAAGFPHFYYPGCVGAADAFLKACARQRDKARRHHESDQLG